MEDLISRSPTKLASWSLVGLLAGCMMISADQQQCCRAVGSTSIRHHKDSEWRPPTTAISSDTIETPRRNLFFREGMAAAAAKGSDKYRSHLYGEAEKNTHWKLGTPPNYDLVNKLFEEGRTREWPPGSLEEKVQNLVKTWEMEMFHKIRSQDYKTVDPENYTLSLNGRKPITLEEKRKLGGGYNSFMQTSLPEQFRCYNPAEENAETSQKAFTTAFPRGFALEIFHVYTGPPVIVYKFRHWGFMEGPFKGHAPTGEMVEFYGIGIFQVNNEMTKIEKVEFFFDRGELLGPLLKGRIEENPAEPLDCPFVKSLQTVSSDDK